jgi:FlaA1/EpsC-like NDP-sugar epimerase
VQVEDVLGREPVEVDLAAVSSYIADATVLVTGAGGRSARSCAGRSRASAASG